MKKKGTILAENIMFIILNLVFITILMLFLLKQGSGAIVIEQSYAKQIALLIDSGQPGMEIILNMETAKKVAEKNGIDFGEVVNVNENIVTVKITSKSGYSYSFFNDVKLDNLYPVDKDKDGIDDSYRIKISGYNKNE
ncbi:hypothetical protein BMS3Abin17_00533 [archaeon BMS3Abin17]|nr:hypothetical protein BMS3Abin17_00533 [archaeon BMS3Abin17]HDZ60449.1 hypothetical protein [Candidatus Pacearchaeota archaeon]